MRKVTRPGFVILLVCLIMAISGSNALAAATRLSVHDVVVTNHDCTTGYIDALFYLVYRVPAGETLDLWYSATAPGATIPNSGHTTTVDGPQSFDALLGWGPFLGPLAPNTVATFRLYDMNSHAETSYTVNCTTGEVKIYNQTRETSEDEPYTGIFLLGEDVAGPYSAVPNADGTLPCGVFDVNGWGTKYVGMADFPACTVPVAVMCLTGDREWTADNVSNVVIRGDYEVDFDSSQHGICAFFPAS